MYSDMKRILLLVAVLLAVLVVVILSSGHRATTPSFWAAGAVKILPAAHTYAKLLKTEGRPIPAFVNVQELVARGLLGQDDLKGFAGMEVSASTSPLDLATNVLIRARQPDGTEMVLLADGSVHQKSR
jgi:hypothetical protein